MNGTWQICILRDLIMLAQIALVAMAFLSAVLFTWLGWATGHDLKKRGEAILRECRDSKRWIEAQVADQSAGRGGT